ncbi:MAG: sulfurtransferase complex subunit TusD [Gammaproteobacteria bacterium]|nr:sulfurtransferase complex subunit TusD [Gammaproteobacteria bacterium]MYJ76228.1 sulfurtransferase complex subunit TusD [Gammaproteobacteria bacterium]
MRIDLLVQGAPLTTGAPERALKFARAAIEAGHRIGRIFFYNDGVTVANRFAADATGTRPDLVQLAAQADIELAVCVTAAGRRGVRANESLAEGFTIVGLGQLVEAIEDSDRLVSF